MIDPRWVKGLAGDDALLKKLYDTYRHPFISFLRKYGLDENESLEIFHDALIALRRQAKSGQLLQVTHSFRTYLFAIGKYKAFDLMNKRTKTILYRADDVPELVDFPDETLEFDQEKSSLIIKGLNLLGKSCQRMLTLFYLKGLKIKEIQELEGYENENTVRAHKSRCLKNLKSWVENQKNHD
jgi:RNA polymerase sigma factor (sigma-70 family)